MRRPNPINVLVPPHLGCQECRKWCNTWHDFWCQIAIAGLLCVIKLGEGGCYEASDGNGSEVTEFWVWPALR